MRTVSAILAGVALLAAVSACRAGGTDAATVRLKIKAGALVVDVRTPAEFAAGAYPGATNIPLPRSSSDSPISATTSAPSSCIAGRAIAADRPRSFWRRTASPI